MHQLALFLLLLVTIQTSQSYDEDYVDDMPTGRQQGEQQRSNRRNSSPEPVLWNLPSDTKPSKSPLFFPGTGSGLFGGSSIFAPQQPARTILLPTSGALTTACCACAPALPATSGAIIATPGLTAAGRITTAGWPTYGYTGFPSVNGQLIALPYLSANGQIQQMAQQQLQQSSLRQQQQQQQQQQAIAVGASDPSTYAYSDGRRRARRLRDQNAAAAASQQNAG